MGVVQPDWKIGSTGNDKRVVAERTKERWARVLTRGIEAVIPHWTVTSVVRDGKQLGEPIGWRVEVNGRMQS